MRREHLIEVFILALLAISSPVDAAQTTTGVAGRVNAPPGVVVARPHPADARLLAPDEFQRADLMTRRRVMSAWAAGSPETAGPAILQLIETAVQDLDAAVRQSALRALTRIAGAANRARLSGAAVVTDPAAYPSLYTLLLQRIDDADPAVRRELVTALVTYYLPQRQDLETALLARIASEPTAGVRARMVLGLGERAKGGSEAALRRVMTAFDDPSTEVRLQATNAISTMAGRGDAVPPDAVARLVQQLSAPEDYVRLAAIRGLDHMLPAVKPHIATLQLRLNDEKDERVRVELARLLERLRPPNRPVVSGLRS